MIKTYQTTLVKKQQLTTNLLLLKFALKPEDKLEFLPGQYIILKIKDKARLYSIFSPNYQKDNFELFVKIVVGGLAGQYFSSLKINDSATFQGPAGLFTLKNNNKDKIFLATVTGLAPIRSMILSDLKRNSNSDINYHLFWGLPNYSDVCLLDELKKLNIQYANFTFEICLSREKNIEMIKDEDKKFFTIGRINYGLENFIKKNNIDINSFDYYICGSREVVQTTSLDLYNKGINKNCVFFEKF